MEFRSAFPIYTLIDAGKQTISLGAIYKIHPQSGGEGLSSADIYFVDKGRGGFFSCVRPHFLMQKSTGFSKFMVCPHEQGG